MSLRKKRMIMIVAGVILCSMVIWFMGEYAMKSDQEEYARRCKYFEGIWSDKDKQMTVEIHRVSSGFLFFSMKNHSFSRDLKLLRAYAVGDDLYEFSYETEAGRSGRIYKIKPGSEGKGTIQLQDDRLKINFPKIPNKSKGLEYTGTLTEKEALPSQKEHHLAEYLGTDKKMAEELKQYCSFYYGDDQKIWRVHAMVAEDGERYKTDIAGITMNSLEQECEQTFGRLVSETNLGDEGSRRQYENDTYVSTVIVNSYGVITELDCQLAGLSGTRREGDFLMKENTLYRYTGDYSQEKTIEIPEGTTKIATHAFDAGEHGYSLSEKKRKISNIDISSKVKVEKDAFANCGPLKIYLKSGWKEIPEGAFAHTVSMENLSKKGGWVTFVLPPTIKKIGDRAFALGESEEKLDLFWKGMNGTDPVSVQAAGLSMWETTYIGDDAFWGIAMKGLPQGLQYLGKNYTISTLEDYDVLRIPDRIETLKKGTFYLLRDVYTMRFSRNMKEIEDGAIRGEKVGKFSVSEDSKYIQQSDGFLNWITSKDGKILYTIDSIRTLYYDDDYEDYYDDDDYYYDNYDYEDDDEDYEDDDDDDEDYEDDDDDDEDFLFSLPKGESRYRFDKERRLILKVPEGIEEIRGFADMRKCDEIIIPKSVKRISVDAFFVNGEWEKITFQGKVPALYGDLSRLRDQNGYLYLGATIKVKKGQKKGLLKQLMGDKKYPKKKKEQLAKNITTF